MLQNRRSLLPSTLWPSVSAGLLWCAAALSAAYWVLQWPEGGGQALSSKAMQGSAESAPSGHQGLARALGVTLDQPAPAAAAAPALGRFQLLGVIAGADGGGSALITTDGQAPKIYRVGQSLGDGWVLQSLKPQRAQLGASLNGPGQLELKLPTPSVP